MPINYNLTETNLNRPNKLEVEKKKNLNEWKVWLQRLDEIDP